MKKHVLTLSLLALTAMPASAAINCATLPTCDSLGYKDKTADCDSSNVLKCPFDQTKGKCLTSGAVIGQISYFAKDPGAGWVLCDGSYYHKDKYPELYAKIGTMYGGGGDIFRMPPYARNSDSFLKSATYTSKSKNMACVPNIMGKLGPLDDSLHDSTPVATGPFTVKRGYSFDLDSDGSGKYCSNCYGTQLEFDASKYNSFYGSCTRPEPASYNVATYIYAGKVGTPSTTAASLASGCKKGYYYYTDGTCSSTRNTSKTMKGKVTYDSYASSVVTVSYVFGGGGSSTYYGAENSCISEGGSGVGDLYDLKDANISTSYDGNISPINTSYTYWYMSTYTYTCTSTSPSSCTSKSGANASEYHQYYCEGYDYLR